MPELTDDELQLKQDIEEAAEIKDVLAALLRTAGWTRLVAILDKQIEARKVSIFTAPLKSRDEIFAQEFMKGEINGLMIVKKMPALLIEAADTLLDESPENTDAE